MQQPGDSGRYFDAVLAVFLCAALALLSPFLVLWTLPGLPWHTPYLLWGLIILATAIVQRLRKRHEL